MIIQVSSHRRSGTHALIDFIRENFSVKGRFYHLEDVLDWPLEKLRSNVIIVKTHEPEPRRKLNHFLKLGKLTDERANEINALTVNVHAYRNPKDVLKSLYYFNIKGHEPVYEIPENMSFLEFLKQEGVQDAALNENRIKFWQRTVESWALCEDVLALDYETIAYNSQEMLGELAKHLRLEPKKSVELDNLKKESTAIGRNTTKLMDSKPLWVDEVEDYYSKEINDDLLKRLKL